MTGPRSNSSWPANDCGQSDTTPTIAGSTKALVIKRTICVKPSPSKISHDTESSAERKAKVGAASAIASSRGSCVAVWGWAITADGGTALRTALIALLQIFKMHYNNLTATKKRT